MSAMTSLTDNLVSLAASSGSGIPWTMIGMIAAVGAIGYAVWYFFFRSSGKGAD